GGVADELAVADRRAVDVGDGREVVGRLRRRMVVEGHPVLGAHRLGGDEAAVLDRVVGAGPALGGAVAVGVHAGPAGVVDLHLHRRGGGGRGGRRDHELVGRAGQVLEGGVGAGGGAGRRVRVLGVDRVGLAGAVGQRIRVVVAVGVAGVGRLDELEL